MTYETELRATAMHVITLYDSGVPKDRIAEMMNVTREGVDEMIAHRYVLR